MRTCSALSLESTCELCAQPGLCSAAVCSTALTVSGSQLPSPSLLGSSTAGRGGGSASAERGRHARDHAVTPNAAGVRAVRGARDTHVPFEPTSHTCTCIMQNIRELCLRAQSQTNTHTQHSTRGGRARVSATQAAGWGSTEGWGSTGFHGAKICNARHPRFGEASSAALTGRPSATP
jgi:hypothetical protein